MMEKLWDYLYNYFKSCKCKFILIVNDVFIMKMIFKDYYYKEYNKKYELTKNICNHILFTNIK